MRYWMKVCGIVLTAYALGSTNSLAPCCFAVRTPAPKLMLPCVNIEPSSMTSTRFPIIKCECSTVTGITVSRTDAFGLSCRIFARTT